MVPLINLSNSLPLLFPLILFLHGCGGSDISFNTPPVVELTEYETVATFEDDIGVPSDLVIGDNGILYIHDSGLERVIALFTDGSPVTEISREGNGPGEFQSVAGLSVTENHLYLVDDGRYLIHRLDLNGEPVSTFDYGTSGIHRINKPRMAGDSLLLIPHSLEEETIFMLKSWNSDSLGEVGLVPENSSNELDYEIYRTEVSDRITPSYFLSHAFAVTGGSGDPFFLVYESIPIIKKYNPQGELLWRTDPIVVPEIDSIATRYYDMMGQILRQTNAISPLRKYRDGISRGDTLFLSTHSGRNVGLWIHEFGSEGQLLNRYRIHSKATLLSQFEVNMAGRTFLILTEESEIRAYSF